MKKILHALMQLLLGDYALYQVFSITLEKDFPEPLDKKGFRFAEIDSRDLLKNADPEIAHTEEYFGQQSYGFGIWQEEQLVSVCWYWYGERYKNRGFWPLEFHEAKLVEIVTADKAQGNGLASSLLVYSLGKMFEHGFTRCYARIWHSNRPSLRIFTKTQWQRIALVFQPRLFSLFPLRVTFPVSGFPRISTPPSRQASLGTGG